MKQFLLFIYHYLKSLFFSFFSFLFSYIFFFLHQNVESISSDDPLSQGERGQLVLSFLVRNTPGGKYTWGALFLIIGVILLWKKTKRLIDRIRNKNYVWHSEEEIMEKEKTKEQSEADEKQQLDREIKKNSSFKNKFNKGK